jgi:hypothetical protein
MKKLLAREVLYSASVGQAATVYTSSSRFYSATGYAAVVLVSSAGSITVTQQVSQDNATWYDPVDEDGTAIGAVAAAMTVGGRYIQVSPIVGQYIRYKIVEGNTAATTVTLTLIFQEEA